MKNWIRGLLQTAIALVLLALWLRTVSPGEVLSHARVHNWAAVALMLILFLVTSLIRARRWLLLLRPLAPVGMVRAFAMNAAASLLNYILPIRSGDAMRGWWLWRRHRVPPGSALATVVIDKVCDLAGVAVVLAVIEVFAATGVVSAPRGLLGAAALAVALLGAVLGTAFLGPRIARSPLARRLLPERIAAALAGQAFAFRAGAKGLWTPALAGRLAAFTAIALLIDAFNFSLLFWAVGVPVPTLKAMAAYPALLLAFAVPAGPGYVGSLEVAGSLVLGGGLGLASAVAAGAIVLYHAITAGYALVLGFIGFLLVGGRRRARAAGPRRIAVFHCGFTYSGGGERVVIEEVLGLRRRGFAVECFAPTVDASRCYPDLIGEVRVRTFLPQLPRWFPFREAERMDRVVGGAPDRRALRGLPQSAQPSRLPPRHRSPDRVGGQRRLPPTRRGRDAGDEIRRVGGSALGARGRPAAGRRRLHRRHHSGHLQARGDRLPGRVSRRAVRFSATCEGALLRRAHDQRLSDPAAICAADESPLSAEAVRPRDPRYR